MKTLPLEVRRQFVHAAGIFTVPLIFFLGEINSLIFLGFLVLALISISLYRKNRNHIKRIFFVEQLSEIEEMMEKFIGLFERRHEKKEIPMRGAIFFYTGAFFSVLFFSENIAAVSIAVLAISDSLSTIIGLKYGEHKLPINSKKSWEGSAAFFVSLLVVLIFFFDLQKILVTALAVTIIEMLPGIDDNLSVPLSTGILLSII